MKKLVILTTVITNIILANENYTTVKNGKVVYIEDPIGFEGTIKSLITIENYKLAKMVDDKGNIIRGRFYKKKNLEINEKLYINCNSYNGIEYKHCY